MNAKQAKSQTVTKTASAWPLAGKGCAGSLQSDVVLAMFRQHTCKLLGGEVRRSPSGEK